MTLKFKHVAWPTHSCPTCNGPINPDEVILNPAQKQRLLTELQKHLANSPFLSDLKPKLQNLFDQMRLPLTAFTFKQVISSGLDRIFHYLPLGILTRHTEKIVNTNKIIQKEDATFRDILRASQKMFDIVNEATKKGEIVRKAYLLSFFKDASLAQESLEKIITNLIDSGTLKPVYHLKNELYYQWDFCDSKVGIYSKAQLRQRFPDRFSKPDSRKRRKTESEKEVSTPSEAPTPPPPPLEPPPFSKTEETDTHPHYSQLCLKPIKEEPVANRDGVDYAQERPWHPNTSPSIFLPQISEEELAILLTKFSSK